MTNGKLVKTITVQIYLDAKTNEFVGIHAPPFHLYEEHRIALEKLAAYIVHYPLNDHNPTTLPGEENLKLN